VYQDALAADERHSNPNGDPAALPSYTTSRDTTNGRTPQQLTQPRLGSQVTPPLVPARMELPRFGGHLVWAR